MSGYTILATRDLLRSEPFLENYPRLRRALPAVAGGAVGMVVGGAHPLLGALIGSAVVKNAVDYATGEASGDDVARHVGAHVVAAVGSLAVPVAPMIGYLGGVIAGNVIFGAKTPSLDDVRSGKSVIKRGMKGDAVKYVQAIVGVVADGNFGPKTEAAVKVFQKKMLLSNIDGVVNQATLIGLDQLAGRAGSGNVATIDFTKPAAPAAPRTTASLPDGWLDPWADSPKRAQSAPTTPASTSPASSALTPVTTTDPMKPTPGNVFLAFTRKPLWDGAPVTRGHALIAGGALAAGGLIVALLR